MSKDCNFYGQQAYGQSIMSQNMSGNNSITYGQFRQQQPIYYGQNQITYPGMVNNQQARQVQQPSISYQVAPIPQVQKQYIYQQVPQQIIYQQNQNQNIHQKVSQNVIYPKNQYQNICDQAPQQSRVHQQNQYQNIYPNQLIYPQQPIQQNNIISNQLISNNQIIKSQNDKYYNQVPISNINKLHSEKKEVILDAHVGLMTKKETDDLYSY